MSRSLLLFELFLQKRNGTWIDSSGKRFYFKQVLRDAADLLFLVNSQYCGHFLSDFSDEKFRNFIKNNAHLNL